MAGIKDINKQIIKFVIHILNMSKDMLPIYEAFPEYPVSSTMWSNEEIEEVGKQILLNIKKPSQIKDVNDLFDIISDEFFIQVKEMSKFSIDSLLERIQKRLDNPLIEYVFSTPISTLSNIGFNFEIGRHDQLIIKNISNKNDPPQMELKGTLIALSDRHAYSQIELHVRHILGLAIALELAYPVLLRVKTLPLTKIKGLFEDSQPLDPNVSGLASMIIFREPPTDEFTLKRIQKNGIGEVLKGLLERIRLVMNTNVNHGIALRSAARLLFDAEASHDEGKSIAFALMSIEAALLEQKQHE